MSTVSTYGTRLVESLREGDWKPLNPGYDFLKMMDAEEKKMIWTLLVTPVNLLLKVRTFLEINTNCLNRTMPFDR